MDLRASLAASRVSSGSRSKRFLVVSYAGSSIADIRVIAMAGSGGAYSVLISAISIRRLCKAAAVLSTVSLGPGR